MKAGINTLLSLDLEGSSLLSLGMVLGLSRALLPWRLP